MKIRLIIILSLVAGILNICQNAQSMNCGKIWKKLNTCQHKGKIATAGGLFALGMLYEAHNGELWQCIDVSHPSGPTILDDHSQSHDTDYEQLTHSLTKLQLTHDQVLAYNPLVYAQQVGSASYQDFIQAVLFGHFWVVNSSLRSALCKLIMYMSYEEAEKWDQGKVSFVHGTNQGASILLRTIFDEVFSDHDHNTKLLFRKKNITNCLLNYKNVHEYYYEQTKWTANSRPYAEGWKIYTPEDKIRNILSGACAHDMLCANFGFFGQSSWLMNGYKESSAEFITSRCSFLYQVFCALLCSWYKPYLPFLVAKDCIKNPSVLSDLNQAFDRHAKYDNDTDLFKEIFVSHGAQEFYPEYHQELENIRIILGAGIVHAFIPEEQAKKWCYISQSGGVRAFQGSEEIIDMIRSRHNELPWYQVRILMHRELLQVMESRFYIIGDPEKISDALSRLYEIAHEVKNNNNS